MRVSVVAYVYGPAGLNRKKVKDFLSRDEELIAQLADYAEKTAQTEALIAALSAPNSSSANVDAALQGFSSKYGLAQLDRTLPTDQQALLLMRTLTPTMVSYDPITPQPSQGVGQTKWFRRQRSRRCSSAVRWGWLQEARRCCCNSVPSRFRTPSSVLL